MEQLVLPNLLSIMLHPHTALQVFPPPLNRGVVATAHLPVGTIIFVRDALDQCISPKQWQDLPPLLQEVADTYSYADKQGNRILGWDLSKYVNHSCQANTMATDFGFEVVVRPIAPGQAITSEYGLLGLLYEYEVDCGCGNCRGKVGPKDRELYYHLWKPLLDVALLQIPHVAQPLWELLNSQQRCQISTLDKVH